jgi:hypothetical protein
MDADRNEIERISEGQRFVTELVAIARDALRLW